MIGTSVDFYVFSGTGNTLLAARAMQEVFAASGVECRLRAMEKSKPEDIDPARALGIAFPVAAFSTYPLVWRFVQSLPAASGTPAFMLDTLAGTSGGAVGPLRKLVENKGYQPAGAREILMPCNIFYRQSETKEKSRLDRGLETARDYARALVAGTARWGRVPLISDAFGLASRLTTKTWSWRIGRVFWRMEADASRCTRCGLCARLCPVGAITLSPHAQTTTACEFCQRCAGVCPVQAMRLRGFRYAPYHAVKADEFLKE